MSTPVPAAFLSAISPICTVAEALKAVDGDIVLMHDVRDDTAAAAEQIIPALVEQGYKLVTVSEMFEAKGIALENGKAYRKAR